MMTKFEIIIILLTLYATVLSTILGIIEIIKKKKHIKLIFEIFSALERVDLVLINNSDRPVLIRGISAKIKRNNYWEHIERDYIFSISREPEGYPFKIDQFDSLRFTLSKQLSPELSRSIRSFRIIVYDNDGKIYKKCKIRNIDPKLGSIENKH